MARPFAIVTRVWEELSHRIVPCVRSHRAQHSGARGQRLNEGRLELGAEGQAVSHSSGSQHEKEQKVPHQAKGMSDRKAPCGL